MVNTLLDPILHQPLRTQIAAYLAGRGHASFSELKRTLDVTDGNLEAHLKKMSECGYMQATKDDTAGSRQTIYSLTRQGLDALADYLHQLERIVSQARPAILHDDNEDLRTHPV